MEQRKKSHTVQVGAFWPTKNENVLSGKLGTQKVVLFRNQNKKGDTHPDWHLCLSFDVEEKAAPTDVKEPSFDLD